MSKLTKYTLGTIAIFSGILATGEGDIAIQASMGAICLLSMTALYQGNKRNRLIRTIRRIKNAQR